MLEPEVVKLVKNWVESEAQRYLKEHEINDDYVAEVKERENVRFE
jgi:hypothetical protein